MPSFAKMFQLLSHPPAVRAVVQVGITGHRPPALPPERFADVQAVLQTILTKVAAMAGELLPSAGCPAALSPDPVHLRLISPLAEGADRLAARAALECGMEIQCPLPFHRGEYERDFLHSRAEFRELLARATAVMELNGDRNDEGTAYLNAGKVVIEQSDVLLAVWDGRQASGRGGTAEIVAKALHSGVPVLVIPLEKPGDVTFLDAHHEKNPCWEPLLRERFEESLALKENEAKNLRRYFGETVPDAGKDRAGWLYNQFRMLLVHPGQFLGFGERGDKQNSKADLRELSPVRQIAEAAFAPHYRTADALSCHYAGKFRSAYLGRYLGVLAAAIATGFGSYATQPRYCAWGFAAEMGFFGLVAVLIFLDSRLKWHLRSLEYRLLAENLRMLHFLHPLGIRRMNCNRSILRDPPTWITWHLRNITGNVGLPSAVVTPDYLARHLHYLETEELKEQRSYHEKTAAMYQKMAKRLSGMMFFAFVTGILFFALRAVATANDPADMGKASISGTTPQQICYWIQIGILLFPALGAVLAGIRSHGEFARLSGRSAMMKGFFEHKERQVKALEKMGPPSWDQSVHITREITEEMQTEISDWRTVISGKNLTFPF